MKEASKNAFSIAWRVVAILVFVVVLLVLGFGFILFGAVFAQQALSSLAGLFGLVGMCVVGFLVWRVLRLSWRLVRETRSVLKQDSGRSAQSQG